MSTAAESVVYLFARDQGYYTHFASVWRIPNVQSNSFVFVQFQQCKVNYCMNATTYIIKLIAVFTKCIANCVLVFNIRLVTTFRLFGRFFLENGNE